MDLGKETLPGRFKSHIIIIGAALFAVVLLAFLTDVSRTPPGSVLPQLVWMLFAVIFLIAIMTLLVKIYKIIEGIEQNGSKLDKLTATADRNRAVLEQINQNIRLSGTAKSIAFRDAERQVLREAVFDKLHQHEFDSADEIIDEIAHSTAYHELAEQLRSEVNKYHGATEQERGNQVISHIEKLFEANQWAKAGTRIESLIAAFPKSEKVTAMRQKLLDKREERKKILLNAWDDAVKRRATDRSLEILRELDSYLTANEAIALQEAAKDVFKTKLHSLGVRFSLAVSAKQWANAIEAGQEIIRDFPNSKMAAEIREKLGLLVQKAQEQSG